jgi:hypothetical protein
VSTRRIPTQASRQARIDVAASDLGAEEPMVHEAALEESRAPAAPDERPRALGHAHGAAGHGPIPREDSVHEGGAASEAEAADIGPIGDDDDAGVPRTIGPYRIYRPIASGGMATVFLARRTDPGALERVIALKRIHEHLASIPKFVQMFLDEARIASRVAHPHVCTVLDFGHAKEGYYLVM